MASKQSTADFLVDQLAAAGDMRSRRMFGEYALYCNDKVVAFICDDRLFVKPTVAGRQFLGDVTEAPAYPGSKMYFLIEEDKWEDRDFLSELIVKTAGEVKEKKSKAKVPKIKRKK
ncbi:MAG: TfoX/Sxy family protein [Candidatus Peribacteraceae bacterium]|nr:TfoX/Sxy family protein [Candidatus Peribacteraceae bacterium]